MPLLPTLRGLEHSVPGLRGAIVCDEEGERVVSHIVGDAMAPFDLDILGASYAALGPTLGGTMSLSGDVRFRIVTAQADVWYQSLRSGYYLILSTAWTPRHGVIHAVIASAAEAIAMDM